jgi:DNA-binding transcriptional LysR family regulator
VIENFTNDGRIFNGADDSDLQDLGLETQPDLFSHLMELPCLGYKPQNEVVGSVCLFYSEDPNGLSIFRTTENYNSLKEMVIAKMGRSIIPSYIRVSFKDAWTLPIPSKILLSRQFYLIYRTGFANLPWFKELISSIHACFRRDIK